jgi:hypothetical protein
MGGMRNAYKMLFRKLEGERPFGRPRHRWENNIGMDLKTTGCDVISWIHLPQIREQWWTLMNTIMNLQIP